MAGTGNPDPCRGVLTRYKLAANVAQSSTSLARKASDSLFSVQSLSSLCLWVTSNGKITTATENTEIAQKQLRSGCLNSEPIGSASKEISS